MPGSRTSCKILDLRTAARGIGHPHLEFPPQEEAGVRRRRSVPAWGRGPYYDKKRLLVATKQACRPTAAARLPLHLGGAPWSPPRFASSVAARCTSTPSPRSRVSAARRSRTRCDVILDNYAVHNNPKVIAWLARTPLRRRS